MMKSIKTFRAALLPAVIGAIGFAALSAPAAADDLLGLYAGAGLGESTVRSDYGFDPYDPTDSHPHHLAWKAFVGIRPIPFVGAEAEYIDFGHPGSSDTFYDAARGDYSSADSHPKAGALFAVGYLPLPLPFVDVFGKLGEARLETNVNSYSSTACSAVSSGCYSSLSRQHAWSTRVAYGAGVQAHFLGVSVRGEYERISSPFGDPDAFMVSAAWNF